MHFHEYLTCLTPALQRALSNDLTVRCGRVAFALRLHYENPRTTVMLGTLAAAHAALQAALTTIDPAAAAGRLPAPTMSLAALPRCWAVLLAGTDAAVVEAWLQMASELAQDAVAATRADTDLTVVRDRVAETLDALATVRDDALACCGC